MTLEVTELTPPGSGAVTVLRLTGTDARSAALSLVSCGVPEVGSFAWTRLRIGEELVDEALLCAPSPGEFELHVHGSPALVRRLREHWRNVADAGFDSDHRAHLGSIEERALRAAASAPSEAAARMLIDQGGGALRTALMELCDLPRARRAAAIAVLRDRGRIARFTMSPTRIVIAGPVNAGKSTLFNVLAGERRVVVSDHPGTTRDVVRAEVLLGAYPILLSDTAGERCVPGNAPADDLERAAQLRAESERLSADLVLRLQAADDPRDMLAQSGAIERAEALLRSCADRVDAGFDREAVSAHPDWISAQTLPEHARAVVERIFHRGFRLPVEPWVAGVAVPFESLQARVLARVADSPTEEDAHALLRSLLEVVDLHPDDTASVAPPPRVH